MRGLSRRSDLVPPTRVVTPLRPTEREPALDIATQFEALLNPESPKNALWVARGTPLPDLPDGEGLEIADFGAGMLVAGAADIARLRADPCEETLSQILGYVAPKSALGSAQELSLFVVQARHPKSGVILEMAIDLHRLGAAVERCSHYGEPVVMTMADCLARRLRLITAEDLKRRR